MSKTGDGELSRYIRRVMKEKHLKQREIERRSGGKITDGYVADLLRGRASNPSIDKLSALACGLGVDPYEVFAVACNAPEPESGRRRGQGPPDITSFLEMMQEVAENPDLIRIMEEALRLTPEERMVIIHSMESLKEHEAKPQPDRQKPQHRKENA
ncbi:MAG: helix-turn-helix domain-containing protein [Blastocatellia bacterium]|nr:helix-turn-helix domain-containing protein [Blastocatellia bacterium]